MLVARVIPEIPIKSSVIAAIIMLKAKIKKVAYWAASQELLMRRLRQKRLKNRIVVLMYHEIANDEDNVEAWTVIKKSSFIQQIDYLRKYFEIVSIADALAKIGSNEDTAKPMAVLTFDDGDAGNCSILLPLAEELDLPVTIFIATGQVQYQKSYWFDRVINMFQGREPRLIDLQDFGYGLNVYRVNESSGPRNWVEIERLLADLKRIDPLKRQKIVETILARFDPERESDHYRIRPLSVMEVAKLASSKNITIGAHSHCHNILTQIEPQEARKSIEGSKKLLEEWSGKAVDYFAYPNGDWNKDVLNIVKESGFKCAFSTEPKFWCKGDLEHAIPRIGVGRYDSIETFSVNLVGGLR